MERGHKARGQGHKKSEAKDRGASVLQKFFQAISKKKGLEKHFSTDLQNFNHLKNSAVLENSTSVKRALDWICNKGGLDIKVV